METILCLTIKWNTITAIATIAYCVIFLFSVFIIKSQLKATMLSTRAATYLGASQMLQDIDVRRSRSLIFDLYNNNSTLFNKWITENDEKKNQKEVAKWADDLKKRHNNSTNMSDFEMLESVIEKYDTVGIMGFKQMLDLEMIIDNWGASLRRTWPIVKPFLYYRREKGKDIRIWNEYEGLVCLAYYFEVHNEIPEKFRKGLNRIDLPLMSGVNYTIDSNSEIIIDNDSKEQMFNRYFI